MDKSDSSRLNSLMGSIAPAHHWLIYHAAFPVAVTPDLLYKIWVNFRPKATEDSTPLSMVPQLLLSPIFRQVSTDIFEIYRGIRHALLEGFRQQPNGPERMQELAAFLKLYVELYRSRISSAAFVEAQQWTADAWLDPAHAAETILKTLSAEQKSGSGRVGYYLSLAKQMGFDINEAPQAGGEAAPLITALRLAEGVQIFRSGQTADAVAKLQGLKGLISDGGGEGKRLQASIPRAVWDIIDRGEIDAEEGLPREGGMREALRRIREAKENDADTIDLSDLDLEYIPGELADLVYVQTIKLTHNPLREIGFDFSQLENLKNLELSNTQLTDISPLSSLRRLEVLKLDDNKIKDIGPLRSLTNLSTLYLSINKIEDISPLSGLKQLQMLFLGVNSISDLTPLRPLYLLFLLDVSYNQITDASPLADLKDLTWLYMQHNNIQDVPNIREDAMLELFDLSFNAIEVLPEWITRYKVVLTAGPNISPESIAVGGNPLKDPPADIIEQGDEALRKYFEQKAANNDLIYERDIIFVGPTAAGKTTVIQKLVNPASWTLTNNVVNIYARQYSLSSEEIKRTGKNSSIGLYLNFWDAPDLMANDSLFKLFPDNAYYVLVVKDSYASEVEQWLRILELYAPTDNILVLIRPIDNTAPRPLGRNLQQAFGRNLEFIYLESDWHDDQSEYILEAIKNMVLPKTKPDDLIPKKFLYIRHEMEKEGRLFFRFSQIEEIYRKHAISSNHDILKLNDYFYSKSRLYRLAITPDLFCDLLFLIYTVYRVRNNNISPDKPFSNQQFSAMLNNVRAGELENAKRTLVYTYQVIFFPTSGTYCIPHLLPAGSKNYLWPASGDLNIRYSYHLNARAVLYELMARLSNYISDTAVSRDGFNMRWENTEAQISLSGRRFTGRLRIQVKGQWRVELMTIIMNFVDNINSGFKRVTVIREIGCYCQECKESQAPSFYQLDNLEKVPQYVVCEKSNQRINFGALVNRTVFKNMPSYVQVSKDQFPKFSIRQEVFPGSGLTVIFLGYIATDAIDKFTQARHEAVHDLLTNAKTFMYTDFSVTPDGLINHAHVHSENIEIFHLEAAPSFVPTDELDEAILAFLDKPTRNGKLQLAVLINCVGENVLKRVMEMNIPAIIVMRPWLRKRSGMIFPAEFYNSLTRGLPIANAFRKAMAAAITEGPYTDQVVKLQQEAVNILNEENENIGGLFLKDMVSGQINLFARQRTPESPFAHIGAGNARVFDDLRKRGNQTVQAIYERRMGGEEIQPNEIYDAIINAYPLPIALQVRRLFLPKEEEVVYMERLRYIVRVYTVSTHFLFFILIAQLWEACIQRRRTIVNSWLLSQLKTFFSNQTPGNRNSISYFAVIRQIVNEIIAITKGECFIKEIIELEEAFTESSPLFDAMAYLDRITEAVEDFNSSVDESIEVAERSLVEFLISIGFLHNYAVASVIGMEALPNRNRLIEYRHAVKVGSAIGRGGRIQMSWDRPLAKGVYLFRKNAESSVAPFYMEALSLSPFIVDENNFSYSDLIHLLFFTSMSAQMDAIYFDDLSRLRQSFILLSKEEEFADILNQFNSFFGFLDEQHNNLKE